MKQAKTRSEGVEMIEEWISTADQLPEDGAVVITKIDDDKGERNVTTLKRRGSLWFLPDGSMYVYYRPTHWHARPKP